MDTGYRKVAFLDTNALHFVDLYLKQARGAGLYPFIDDKMDVDNAITEAKTRLGSMSEKNLRKSLGHGLDILAWIVRERIRVEYSPLSELELMTGRLRGKALLHAAEEGVPDRLWGRIRDDEIADRLAPDDFHEVKTAVDQLGAALKNLEIEVSVNPEQAKDALDLAKHVSGLVYMGAVDCVIYSHALVAQADYLITNDGYLRTTVNCIESRPSHREINAQLRDVISQVTLGGSSEVVFPEAKRPMDLPKL